MISGQKNRRKERKGRREGDIVPTSIDYKGKSEGRIEVPSCGKNASQMAILSTKRALLTFHHSLEEPR